MTRAGPAYARSWTEPSAPIDATSGVWTSRRHRYNGWVRPSASASVLAPIAALALGVSGCGGGGGGEGTSTTQSTTTGTAVARPTTPEPPQAPHPEGKKHQGGGRAKGPGHRKSTRRAVKQAVSQTKPARLSPAQRQAAGVVRDYVGALDSRDGERACRLFVPGGLEGVRFPRDRGSCASSLDASIGYRDPRGFPVYDGSRVARIKSVDITGGDARVVATVVTDFAGSREPSIEDDVVYLQRGGGGWLIVKPSASLYRSIGVGDIPPTVLAPPK